MTEQERENKVFRALSLSGRQIPVLGIPKLAKELEKVAHDKTIEELAEMINKFEF